jgi:hypothetical protein
MAPTDHDAPSRVGQVLPSNPPPAKRRLPIAIVIGAVAALLIGVIVIGVYVLWPSHPERTETSVAPAATAIPAPAEAPPATAAPTKTPSSKGTR